MLTANVYLFKDKFNTKYTLFVLFYFVNIRVYRWQSWR